MTAATDRTLRTAYVRYDRLTAWGCTQRGRPFDAGQMNMAWEIYQWELEEAGYGRIA